MTVAMGVVRAAANTSTGNQDFRDPNMSVTPTAAMFFITRATADGVAADHAIVGGGAAKSTTERWAWSIHSEHALGTTDANKIFMADQCICLLDSAGTAVDGEADFVSFLADVGAGAGVRINWGNAPASAYLVTVVLFAADNVACGTYTTGAAASNTTTVTPGFELSDLFTVSTGQGSSLDTIETNAPLSMGVAHYDGATITQRAAAIFDRDNAAVVGVASQGRTDRVALEIGNTGAEIWGSELTAVTATQFTVTQRTAGGGGDVVGYLALDFGSVGSWVGDTASPTATGNQAISTPGFPVQGVMMFLSAMEAFATAYTDTRAGSYGISVFTANDEYSNTISIEDASDPSNTQSLSDDTAVNMPGDAGAALCTASFVSMNANGWTLNHTAVAGTAKIWFAFALEQDAPPVSAVGELIGGKLTHSVLQGRLVC